MPWAAQVATGRQWGLSSTRILVTDFDGTITANDFYLLVARQYMPRNAPDYWARYASGGLTHFEAMQEFFSHTPSDPVRLERLLDETGPDPQLAAAIARLRGAGWELIIASAGSDWYIHRLLGRAGITGVAVHANPGEIEPGRGLKLRLPEESPFFSADAGIDKAAIVRDARRRAGTVAFAGDGPPDVEPALLVEPALRYATGWLAAELKRRGEPFRPFRRWHEIAADLLRDGRYSQK